MIQVKEFWDVQDRVVNEFLATLNPGQFIDIKYQYNEIGTGFLIIYKTEVTND